MAADTVLENYVTADDKIVKFVMGLKPLCSEDGLRIAIIHARKQERDKISGVLASIVRHPRKYILNMQRDRLIAWLEND